VSASPAAWVLEASALGRPQPRVRRGSRGSPLEGSRALEVRLDLVAQLDLMAQLDPMAQLDLVAPLDPVAQLARAVLKGLLVPSAPAVLQDPLVQQLGRRLPGRKIRKDQRTGRPQVLLGGRRRVQQRGSSGAS